MPQHKIVILEDSSGWRRFLIDLAKTAGRNLPDPPEVLGCSTVKEASAEMPGTDLLIVDMGLNEEDLPSKITSTRGLHMLREYDQTPAMVVSGVMNPQQTWDLRDHYANVIHFFEKSTFDEHKFIEAIRSHLRKNPPCIKEVPSRIFVSYSSNDIDRAEHIIERLKAFGVPAFWMDQWEIKPGDNVINSLQGALEDCTRLLLLLSKSSINSHWVTNEWHTALAKGKQIIPIKLDDCETPAFLSYVKSVDMSADEDQQLKALAEMLLKEVSA